MKYAVTRIMVVMITLYEIGTGAFSLPIVKYERLGYKTK
jgi:hypothetical protein